MKINCSKFLQCIISYDSKAHKFILVRSDHLVILTPLQVPIHKLIKPRLTEILQNCIFSASFPPVRVQVRDINNHV